MRNIKAIIYVTNKAIEIMMKVIIEPNLKKLQFMENPMQVLQLINFTLY
jgi:hypothetical protein